MIQDDEAVVEAALKRAKAAFETGKSRPLAFRAAQLKALLGAVVAQRRELCEALWLDLGRDHYSSWFYELTLVETELEHALIHLPTWIKPVPIETPILIGPAESRIVYEPLGVIAVMGSWNFPMLTTLAPLVSVISSGNGAVVKPSELAPHSSNAMAKLLNSCLDPELYQCVEGRVKVAVSLTQARVDGLCFTGSSEKGKLVAQAAAKNLVPCVLELGGKSPLVVDEGCDLDLAAKKAAFGRFMNAGQACVASDYVLVHESLSEELITKLEHYLKVFWQDGKDPAFGQVVGGNRARLEALLQTCGGQVIRQGELALVVDPDLGSPLMKEEIFGPILPIVRFGHISEAIGLIRSLDKPLVIYYCGPHRGANFRRLEAETSSGTLISNETMIHLGNSHMPFGGVGASGYGRYHGLEGFKAFSNCKGVMQKPPLNMLPFTTAYPPYTAPKQWVMSLLQSRRNLGRHNPLRVLAQIPYTYGPLAKL